MPWYQTYPSISSRLQCFSSFQCFGSSVQLSSARGWQRSSCARPALHEEGTLRPEDLKRFFLIHVVL